MLGIEAGCGPEEITAPGYEGVGNCAGAGGIGKAGTGAVAGAMEGPIAGPMVEVSTLQRQRQALTISGDVSHCAVIRTPRDLSPCV